ncbi:multidrug resistance protein MdtA [Edaphobacter acidisoli]|uniref:Multidrug resistance protein MdtA n=1 Tax=Edaphobacter acidisoli TaxID=2040573 RepID=A0A916RSM3_9BACT|nr:multidrug resistance protein MdtA [Edaphobacter acidisoli]
MPPSGQGSTSPEPEQPQGSIFRKILVVLIILAAIGAAVWKIHSNTVAESATSAKLAAAADRPTPVQVMPVVQKTMPIYLTELGTVTAYYTVTLKTRVDGQLIRVNVREGQAVRKGELLAEIDPAPYQAALAQAQGQLVKDQANAANAQAEASRYTALFNAGVVSKESQQAQVSTAGQAQGSIDADKAAIEAARVNLNYTKITSPIDGVVGLRLVDPGNIVHATDTTGLLVVTQLQPIAVIFTLPEDQLPQVLELMRGGNQLAVDAYDRSGTTHIATGRVLTVDNQIDPTTGTVKVKAVFNNKDGALFPNQFVNIRLILQQRPNALVIPASALQSGAQGNFVFLVKQGNPPSSKSDNDSSAASQPESSGSASSSSSASGQKKPHSNAYVVAQPVQVDLTEGAQVILKSGLTPGDQVVVDGQEKLKDGSRVTVHTAQKTPNPITTSSDQQMGLTNTEITGPVPNPAKANLAAPNGKDQLGLRAPRRQQPAGGQQPGKGQPATGQAKGQLP